MAGQPELGLQKLVLGFPQGVPGSWPLPDSCSVLEPSSCFQPAPFKAGAPQRSCRAELSKRAWCREPRRHDLCSQDSAPRLSSILSHRTAPGPRGSREVGVLRKSGPCGPSPEQQLPRLWSWCPRVPLSPWATTWPCSASGSCSHGTGAVVQDGVLSVVPPWVGERGLVLEPALRVCLGPLRP